MKSKIILSAVINFILMNINFTSFSQVTIGVFADCQYCDCETSGSRFYRNSPEKLDECIRHFNQNKNISFVVGLGDLIDRDFASFDKVNTVLATSKKKVYHVIGNHDFSVEKPMIEKIPEKLELGNTRYSFTKKGWLFVFLDGNDITFNSVNPEIVKLAETMTARLKQEGKPNFHNWNGGLGANQLTWLEQQLQHAEIKKLKVAVFCHYPLLPYEAHALWNQEETLNVLKQFTCVKLWMNGHNHSGNYVFQHGIHFVNLKGMVETKNENTFAEVTLSKNRIEIRGFGREENRMLKIE